jgi:Domain of unknown function (DUF6265)
MLRMAILFLACAPVLSSAQAPPRRATIADVAWLAGTWVSVDGDRTVEEHWTPPAGGAMLAVSRTIAGGRLSEFEFLRIVERDGRLLYVAQPNGRPPTEFAMTRLESASVIFENAEHDFPKMIRYTARADGTLVASIAGGGGARERSWVFLRQPPRVGARD